MKYNFCVSVMYFFKVFQIDEMQYLGRYLKQQHQRPKTMKKFGEFGPPKKDFEQILQSVLICSSK